MHAQLFLLWERFSILLSIVRSDNARSEIISIAPIEVWFAFVELRDGLGFLLFGCPSHAKAVDELLELF